MLALALMLTAVATLSAKNALIIVAHGSPGVMAETCVRSRTTCKKAVGYGKTKGNRYR